MTKEDGELDGRSQRRMKEREREEAGNGEKGSRRSRPKARTRFVMSTIRTKHDEKRHRGIQQRGVLQTEETGEGKHEPLTSNRRCHLCIERFRPDGHLSGVERILELIGVSLVDPLEDGVGRGVRGSGEKNEFDAWKSGKRVSKHCRFDCACRSGAKETAEDGEEQKRTGGRLQAGHFEGFRFNRLDSRASWQGRYPCGDGVDGVEGGGENEVVVRVELSETLCRIDEGRSATSSTEDSRGGEG